MEDSIPDIFQRVRTGIRTGLLTSFKILAFVFPLYIVVSLLKNSPLISALGEWLSPLMALFGLPGEAAVALIVGMVLNIYAAVAILANFSLTPWQVTQCGLMLGIAHELLLEGGVMRSAGMRGVTFILFRIAMAVLCGLGFAAIHRIWG